jgi:hypothetical protein
MIRKLDKSLCRAVIRSTAPCIVLGITLISAAAHAQFNGPPSLGTTEINRPITFTTDTTILYPTEPDLVLQAIWFRFASTRMPITLPSLASPPMAPCCCP